MRSRSSGGERRVALDRLDDDRLARADLREQLARLEHPPHRPLVEPARPLVAVVREEGRARALLELEHRASTRHGDLGAAGREPGVEGGRERFGHGGLFGKAPCCHVRGHWGKCPARPRSGGRPPARANVRRVAQDPFLPEASAVLARGREAPARARQGRAAPARGRLDPGRRDLGADAATTGSTPPTRSRRCGGSSRSRRARRGRCSPTSTRCTTRCG